MGGGTKFAGISIWPSVVWQQDIEHAVAPGIWLPCSQFMPSGC